MPTLAVQSRPLAIYCLPMFVDNYVFLWHDRDNRQVAVVDPGDSRPVLQQLQKLQAPLTHIYITHHHRDHIGGIPDLQAHYPQVKIAGSARDRGTIPGQTKFFQGGEEFYFGSQQVQVLAVPGHTQGHLAYYLLPQGDQPGDLFCGDTLFGCGCGRLKDGTPAQLWSSLQRLRNLPDTTRVWCAHEYTLTNLEFALRVDPENPILQARYQAVKAIRAQRQPSIPTELGLEKQTNPFLRCECPELQQAMQAYSPLETFTRLRGLRDQL